MKLALIELKSSLSQQITTGIRPIHLYAIRPHLYRHQSPAGSLTLQIQDASGGLIASSDTVAISAIGSGTYWHGDQRFLISADLEPGTIYRVALVSSGYSFSESAYIGWNTDFDLRKVSAGFTPNVGMSAALLMEIWESRETWMRVG